jgi:hypothetical protein
MHCYFFGAMHMFRTTLPESEASPSVSLFAECLLSDTRQSRLCREPYSAKLGSRQRASLPSAGHSAQDHTRQRWRSAKVALGKGLSAAVLKLTAVSLCREPRFGTRQRVFFAECQILGTRQRTLCRVSSLDTRQSIFLFFLFCLPNFLWYVPTLCRPICIICGQL